MPVFKLEIRTSIGVARYLRFVESLVVQTTILSSIAGVILAHARCRQMSKDGTRALSRLDRFRMKTEQLVVWVCVCFTAGISSLHLWPIWALLWYYSREDILLT